jgi:hypothetical protein
VRLVGASRCGRLPLSTLAKILRTSLAILFLGLSWLWDQLARPVHWLLSHIPLESLKQAVIRFMQGLSPYATLLVFLVPIVTLEPMKIVAVWLFAHHHYTFGLCTYVGADIVRLAIVAFLFKACRDKLMSIRWFAWCYGWVEWAHDWAHRQVEPIRRTFRRWASEAGISGSGIGLWTRIRALWRYSRRRRTARP